MNTLLILLTLAAGPVPEKFGPYEIGKLTQQGFEVEPLAFDFTFQDGIEKVTQAGFQISPITPKPFFCNKCGTLLQNFVNANVYSYDGKNCVALKISVTNLVKEKDPNNQAFETADQIAERIQQMLSLSADTASSLEKALNTEKHSVVRGDGFWLGIFVWGERKGNFGPEYSIYFLPDKPRTWHSKSGSTFEAHYVRHNKHTLTVAKDGKEFSTSRKTLTDEDQAALYVLEVMGIRYF